MSNCGLTRAAGDPDRASANNLRRCYTPDMPLLPPRLVLFDIDGTLVSTGGRAGRALLRALAETYRPLPADPGFSFAGKTDPQIMRELLTANGVAPGVIDEHREQAIIRYLEHLEEVLEPGSVKVLPGVRAILDALAPTPEATVGLLTGNVEGGAALKLRAAGLDGEFFFGAFGSDAEDRNVLVPIARERAFQATGIRFPAERTVVVGDAEADIHCARAGRARAVAVATGWTSRDALAALKPDALLDSLADPDALAALLDGNDERALVRRHSSRV